MNAVSFGYHRVVAMSNREEELFLPEGCIYAAEAEGYGPYKPVPPPKPLSAQASPPPPPYRLPPGLSLSGLSALSGLSGLSPGLPGSATDGSGVLREPLSPSPRLLHTHSSKFPIEREVILSGSDKDSKIPILHEYKKRPKSASAIAPDAPSRSLAWTEDRKAGGMQHDVELRSHPQAGQGGQGQQAPGLGHGYAHGGMASSHDGLDTMGHVVYKAQPLHVTQDSPVSQPRPVSYHPGSTGTAGTESIYGSTPNAMPRTWTTTDSPTRSRQQIERQQQLQQLQQQQQQQRQQLQQQQHQQQQSSARQQLQQLQQQDMYAITADPSATSTPTGIEPTTNGLNGTTPSNGAGGAGGVGGAGGANKDSTSKASRTYHSIKDLISSRFGSKASKDADVESALNNHSSPPTAQPQPLGQPPQAAVRYNGMPDDAGQPARTPTTPRQRVAQARKEDDYQHLPANAPAATPASAAAALRSAYRQAEAEEEGGYGTTAVRYGKTAPANPTGHVPVNSPYQRVPMPHAGHPGHPGHAGHPGHPGHPGHAEPIYQRYSGTPSKQHTPQQQQQQQQQQQPRPLQQGSSNAAVSSPQTLLREHGVYMVMRQPLYGQTKPPEGEGTYGQTKAQGAGPQAQPHQHDETPKGVTYGGGLYQVVHDSQQGKANPTDRVDRADPNEVYVDQDPYGRTPVGPAQEQGLGAAAAAPTSGTPAAPQVRRGSQSQPQQPQQPPQPPLQPPPADEDDDEGGFVRQDGRGAERPPAASGPGSGGSASNPSSSSDYDKAGLSRQSQSDSGRGSTVYSSGTRSKVPTCLDTSTELPTSPQTPGVGHPCEWADMVESELRQILDNSLGNTTGANSTLSESISSMTPPLPPLSPGGSSPGASPRATARYGHSQSLPYGTKPDYSLLEFGSRKGVHAGGLALAALAASGKRGPGHAGHAQGAASARGWRPGKQLGHKKKEQLQMSAKGSKGAVALGLEDGVNVDLDSMLDGATNTEENNTSEEDEDMSTTVDASDTRAIRKQLEGLEGMYSEVLKLLGVRRQRARYQPSDPRVNKRRLYGSLSSLPSSVSSRPVRDLRDRRHQRHDDRKKVRDLEGINKRFQRLESHVVTLARSVAHLSSEMRTQHLMIREMEHIRSEMASLRTQTNMIAARSQSQSVPRGLNQLLADKDPRKDRLRDPAAITNPSRVKKLTKFFGDEPPLLRIFLKKLGYEKYAGAFEQERVGMVELPYLTEERLQKMGIPMGPRLRILQEAQISACRDTVYVV